MCLLSKLLGRPGFKASLGKNMGPYLKNTGVWFKWENIRPCIPKKKKEFICFKFQTCVVHPHWQSQTHRTNGHPRSKCGGQFCQNEWDVDGGKSGGAWAGWLWVTDKLLLGYSALALRLTVWRNDLIFFQVVISSNYKQLWACMSLGTRCSKRCREGDQSQSVDGERGRVETPFARCPPLLPPSCSVWSIKFSAVTCSVCVM
jgi:hypothetical protein